MFVYHNSKTHIIKLEAEEAKPTPVTP